MDIKKVKLAIETLKEDLDGALLSTDIWMTGTGQAIAGYNQNPQATALFEKVTLYMNKALSGAGFPGLNRFYMLDLDGDTTVIILRFGNEYQWGLLVDNTKVQLGLLLNIAVPNARKIFEEAI